MVSLQIDSAISAAGFSGDSSVTTRASRHAPASMPSLRTACAPKLAERRRKRSNPESFRGGSLDRFAGSVVGPRFGRTRCLAMRAGVAAALAFNSRLTSRTELSAPLRRRGRRPCRRDRKNAGETHHQRRSSARREALTGSAQSSARLPSTSRARRCRVQLSQALGRDDLRSSLLLRPECATSQA